MPRPIPTGAMQGCSAWGTLFPMTRLTLLRHAKSSWDHPELTDLQRPLNGRGRRSARLMGAVCAGRFPAPDLIVLSPSVRTRETVRLFLEAWAEADRRAGTAEIMVTDDLYLAGRSDWIRIIGDIAGRGDHIIGCGHQPGLGDFISWLDPEFRREVPTAAVISFPTADGLFAAERGCCAADFFGKPRDFES